MNVKISEFVISDIASYSGNNAPGDTIPYMAFDKRNIIMKAFISSHFTV